MASPLIRNGPQMEHRSREELRELGYRFPAKWTDEAKARFVRLRIAGLHATWAVYWSTRIFGSMSNNDFEVERVEKELATPGREWLSKAWSEPRYDLIPKDLMDALEGELEES